MLKTKAPDRLMRSGTGEVTVSTKPCAAWLDAEAAAGPVQSLSSGVTG